MSSSQPDSLIPNLEIPDGNSSEPLSEILYGGADKLLVKMQAVFGDAAIILLEEMLTSELHNVNLADRETAYKGIYDVFHRYTDGPFPVAPEILEGVYWDLINRLQTSGNEPELGGDRRII